MFAASPFDAFVEKRGSARRRGTFGMIVHEMGRLIVEGAYAAGTTMPREDELIAKLNVSRTPFREAMKTLAAKGLVEIRPKTGTRVRERSDWHHTDPDVMVWHYEAGPSKEFLDSLADLRRVLEPAAAARAAKRATKADVARIAKAYRGMCDTIGDPKGHSEADRDFHTAIFLATHNLMLSQMIDLIVVGIYANAVMASPAVVEGQRQSLSYHAAVLAAIEAKDPIAATAAADRLLDSWNPVPELFAWRSSARKRLPTPETKRRPNADH